MWVLSDYRQISNIRCTKFQNFECYLYRLAVVFAQSNEARCYVVGAVSTGNAPTTSEWSTILLPTKVDLILRDLTVHSIWIAIDQDNGVPQVQWRCAWTLWMSTWASTTCCQRYWTSVRGDGSTTLSSPMASAIRLVGTQDKD